MNILLVMSLLLSDKVCIAMWNGLKSELNCRHGVVSISICFMIDWLCRYCVRWCGMYSVYCKHVTSIIPHFRIHALAADTRRERRQVRLHLRPIHHDCGCYGPIVEVSAGMWRNIQMTEHQSIEVFLSDNDIDVGPEQQVGDDVY